MYMCMVYVCVHEYEQVPMAVCVQRLEEDSGVLLYGPVASSLVGSLTEHVLLFLTNSHSNAPVLFSPAHLPLTLAYLPV